MYILVVRKDKKVIFHKEYKNFEDLMEKFEKINFSKDNLTYNIYKNMLVSEIIHDFLGINDEIEKVKNELKDLLKEL